MCMGWVEIGPSLGLPDPLAPSSLGDDINEIVNVLHIKLLFASVDQCSCFFWRTNFAFRDEALKLDNAHYYLKLIFCEFFFLSPISLNVSIIKSTSMAT